MLGPVIGGLVAASLGIRESFIFCAALYLTAAVLGFVFVREPKESIAPRPSAGQERRGSLIADLREVISERQVILMLGLLFALWLSTTFVRPVMPLSIEDFNSSKDRTADAAVRVHISLPLVTFDVEEAAATGIVFGIIGLTSTVAALSIVPLGARIGYRNCVAGAALLTGALYIPVALAGSFTAFMLMLGAVGLFQGAMVPGTNALIAVSVPDGKQGSAFGLAASMQSLSLLLGPLGGGLTSGLLGTNAVYVVIGIILIGASIAGYALIREPDSLSPRRSTAVA